MAETATSSPVPKERTTAASKEIAHTSLETLVEQHKAKIKGMDGVRDRRKPSMDRFDLSQGGTVRPEDHYENAGPDRRIAFIRRPEVSDKLYHEGDQLFLARQKCDGVEVVRRKNADGSLGGPVIEDDTMAISIPIEKYAEYLAEEQIDADSYLDDLEEARAQEYSDASLRDIANDSRRRAHESGITGPFSPTHGLDYATARHRYSAEDIAMMEASSRRGNRHVEMDQRMAEAKDRAAAAKVGKKSFSMGAGLKDGKIVR